MVFLKERRGIPRFEGEEKGPLGVPIFGVRKFLSEWEPLIPGRPKVFAQQEFPPGVTREQAVEIVAGTDWAQGLARGMCSKLFGVAPGTAEYEACVRRVSRKVAEGVLT
ncbi:MAG: hypothetical protein JRE40_10140 [Deltaproteobacteria bacterium]|nr:hypothetical protein [Deltaproteobacteria bacterium]